MCNKKTVKVIDFIDDLGLAGLVTSVDGESACSSVISYVTDPAKIAKAAKEVTGVTYNSRDAGKGSLLSSTSPLSGMKLMMMKTISG